MVPNLYIENGWKSPFPSIYKWLFRVPMPHTSIYNWARGPPWRGHTLKYPQMTWQNLHVTRAFYPQKRTAPTWGFVPWFGICPIYVCIYVCEIILIHIIYIYVYIFQYTVYLSNLPNRSMLLPTSPSSQILPQLPAVDASSRMTKPPGHRLQWVISRHRFASLNTLAKLQAAGYRRQWVNGLGSEV